MTIIDRVIWRGNPDLFAWKYPSDNLSTWTQLEVSETQEAFLVKNGVYDGPFTAGRHTLSTANIPLLRTILGIPFGGKSPFVASVWFVNKIYNLDILWGTTDPINVEDPMYKIAVPVRAYGQYGIQVYDSKKFLIKLVGKLTEFNKETISAYIRGVLITRTKTLLVDAMVSKKIPILQVGAKLDELSANIQTKLSDEFRDFGINVAQFSIHSINFPENDQSIITLKKALARKAEMSIVGYDYAQERSFDVMRDAASNKGTAGSMLGAGMGIGMGVGVGQPLGQNIGEIANGLRFQKDAGHDKIDNEMTYAKKIEILKDLAALKESGVLSEEEFSIEKKKILG